MFNVKLSWDGRRTYRCVQRADESTAEWYRRCAVWAMTNYLEHLCPGIDQGQVGA